MGLKPVEVKALCLRDFNLMLTGYQKRQEKEINQTRHLMAFIRAFGGMGSPDVMQPQDIWPLSMDNTDVKRMITNKAQAEKLLGEFYEALKVMSN